MKIAHIVASRSTCTKRKVGAVIVKDKHIVSTGYNNPSCGLENCDISGCQLNAEGKCIKAVHAEINALIQASAEEMKGATIYITCSPCSNCQLAIMNSGITRVVYDEYHQAKVDWIKGKILCEQVHVDSDISIENIRKDNSNKEPFNKEHIDEFGHVYVDFFNSKDGITFKDYLNECNIDTSTDIDTLNEVDELNKSFDLSTITCDNKFFDVHVDVKDESTETLDKVLASHKR
jgi:dCMP deaminase